MLLGEVFGLQLLVRLGGIRINTSLNEGLTSKFAYACFSFPDMCLDLWTCFFFLSRAFDSFELVDFVVFSLATPVGFELAAFDKFVGSLFLKEELDHPEMIYIYLFFLADKKNTTF